MHQTDEDMASEDENESDTPQDSQNMNSD